MINIDLIAIKISNYAIFCLKIKYKYVYLYFKEHLKYIII